MGDGDYIGFRAATVGPNRIVSRTTLLQAIERGEVRVFESGKDRRYRLLRRRDVEKLARPRAARAATA